jgi:hypothetical protein
MLTMLGVADLLAFVGQHGVQIERFDLCLYRQLCRRCRLVR